MTDWVHDLLEKAEAATPKWEALPNGSMSSLLLPIDVINDFENAIDPPTVRRLCELVLEAEEWMLILSEYAPGQSVPNLNVAKRDASSWLARLREGE